MRFRMNGTDLTIPSRANAEVSQILSRYFAFEQKPELTPEQREANINLYSQRLGAGLDIFSGEQRDESVDCDGDGNDVGDVGEEYDAIHAG